MLFATPPRDMAEKISNKSINRTGNSRVLKSANPRPAGYFTVVCNEIKLMANNKAIKKKIFDHGVKAISVASKIESLAYHCPICGNVFSEEDLNNGILTLEHVPPGAQGGKGIALTCKNCNNTAGRTVDSAVDTRNHLDGIKALTSSEGSFNTRVRVDFGQKGLDSVNYELDVKDGAVRFYPVCGANHPDYPSRMQEFLKTVNEIPNEERSAWNMTTRKKYNPWYAKVGDLRSAFLVAFSLFGYRYAFSKELEPVRSQILNYDDRLIDYFCIATDLDFQSSYTLGFVTSPFSAVFCQLQNYGVFLPWKDSPKPFYDHLANLGQQSNNQNFKFTPILWPSMFEAKLDFMN